MNEQEFQSYCRDFSESTDKSEFFDKYYDQNAVFSHPIKGEFKGKKAITDFWTAGHQGIHETLEPVNFLVDGNRIAVEVKIEWHCEEDTDYLGPREKGCVYHAEAAGFFHLKDGKFIRAKIYLNEVAPPPKRN